MTRTPTRDNAPLALRLGRKLAAAGLTLSCAESCTGGLVSQLITAVPGSSKYFLGGVISYSNAAKEKLLGVSPATLRRHGAVSAECALEMARGAAKVFRSGCALSVTGIAGPGGASPGKPAGLVYFALKLGSRERCLRRRFPGGRSRVRRGAADFVLGQLLKIIK